MNYITIIGIALSLAMDAFSVCIVAGIIIDKPSFRHYFRLAFHFGLFQFLMPIIGYFGGVFIEQHISKYDHWLALILLSMVGLNMIKKSFSDKKNKSLPKDPSRGLTLIVLSIATSIDAAAVGLSFGMLKTPVFIPSIIIGIVCALLSIVGLSIGKKAGIKSGKWVERAGGIILICIGFKILFEHLLE